MSRPGRIGVDLGGTKIEAIALVEGRIEARERVPTPQGDYEATIAAIRDLVESVAGRAGLDAERASMEVPLIHPCSC